MSVLPARYRRNVLTTYAATVTTAVVALVMTPVLANGLGPEAYGIWVLVASFALYLELLEFGFGKVAPKEVAAAHAAGDAARLRASITTAFWVLAALGGVALVLALGVAAAFPELFGVDGELRTAARILALLILVDLAISIPLDTFGGVLMGLQRFDLVNVTLIVVTLAQAVGWTIVIATGEGLVLLGIVTVVLSLLGQLARWALARRLVPGTSISPRRIDRGLLRPFTRLSGWFAVLDIAAVVVVRLDPLVVGLGVGVAAAGVYAVGQRLTLALQWLIDPVTKAFFPHSASLSAGSDLAAMRNALVAGTRVSLAVAVPVALTLALLAGPILDAWVGDGFEEAGRVVVLLAAATAVAAVTRTGLLMLQGAGRVRGPALITGGEALLNLVLSVALVAALGLWGVALATLIAATAVNLLVLYPYVCRAFGLGVGELSWLLARAHLPALAVAVPAGLLVAGASPDGILAVAGAGVGIVILYVAVFAVTGMAAEERRALAAALRRL